MQEGRQVRGLPVAGLPERGAWGHSLPRSDLASVPPWMARLLAIQLGERSPGFGIGQRWVWLLPSHVPAV